MNQLYLRKHKKDPELQKMFNAFYSLKQKNLERALGELYQHIRTYQFDHHFKTPGFLVTINLELSKPSAVDDTSRWGSLLNWF